MYHTVLWNHLGIGPKEDLGSKCAKHWQDWRCPSDTPQEDGGRRQYRLLTLEDSRSVIELMALCEDSACAVIYPKSEIVMSG
jgi:hypothetical protein